MNNGSSDACGIASLSFSRKAFSCANLGSNAVTLTVTDVHGNVASAPATIAVMGVAPAPTIAVTPTSKVYTGGIATTLYLGYSSQSATLTASGGVSYTWSPAVGLSNPNSANPVFTISAAGTFTYTVTATNTYGCTATKSVTLTVVDVTDGDISRHKVIVCYNGHEISISESAVDTHLSQHHDELGLCSRTGSRPVAADSDHPNQLAVYPNPITDQATISFLTPLDAQAKVMVYNQMGQLMNTLYDGAVSGGQLKSLTLNCQNLATGLYECHLVVGGKTETIRLVAAR